MESLKTNEHRSVSIKGYEDDDDDHEDPRCVEQLSLKVIASGSKQSSISKSFALSAKPLTSYSSLAVDKHRRLLILHSHLFATILEDVLLEIRILGECSNAMRHYKVQFDMPELRGKKYGVQTCKTIDEELSEINQNDLESDIYKLQKYTIDRNMCFTVLSQTYLGLALYGSYEALLQNRNTVENRCDYFLMLIDEEAKNRDTYRDLKRQRRQQANRMKSNIYETNLVMDQLVTDFEDAAQRRNCRDRYIDKWENSREEQNDLRIKTTEGKHSSTIMYYRIKADEEQRVHTELEDLINITVSETLKQIEDFMAKYDKDIEVMDYNISKMRVNYEKRVEMRLEMEKQLADHGEEIKKWLQFKAEREKLREYEAKMEYAAIVVQAWWRGLLVRMNLGPFKPTLQKKKNKKKQK